jgi:two-component sensor histidine kinase
VRIPVVSGDPDRGYTYPRRIIRNNATLCIESDTTQPLSMFVHELISK